MSLSEFHWHERGKDDTSSVWELFYCQLNGANLKLEVTD